VIASHGVVARRRKGLVLSAVRGEPHHQDTIPVAGMSKSFAGHYPIEPRLGEIERLHIQAAAMATDTRVMLDRIGVKAGWTCLDVGCGPRGITDLLSERVGPDGRVIGLDKDEGFLAHARTNAPANAEFRRGDADN